MGDICDKNRLNQEKVARDLGVSREEHKTTYIHIRYEFILSTFIRIIQRIILKRTQ